MLTSCPTKEVHDVDEYVKTSPETFLVYRLINPRKRTQILLKYHVCVTSVHLDFVKLLVYETGKPIAEALGEVDYALGFAEEAALAASCTIIVKPSPVTPLSVLALANFTMRAGVPPSIRQCHHNGQSLYTNCHRGTLQTSACGKTDFH